VVSHTVEAGLRGTEELKIGTLSWKLGGFRTKNTDDILAIPSPVVQGFGYFQNVGDTRRQGVEAEVNLKASQFQLSGSYAFVDARFLTAQLVGSNSPFADAMAMSRSCRATRFPPFRATGSRPASIIRSRRRSRSAATRSIYATYGTFFDINAIPNLANNGAPFANPDSLSPALPRAFYAGLKATF
jgi:outer membrane receptor protein involved in Fe transport